MGGPIARGHDNLKRVEQAQAAMDPSDHVEPDVAPGGLSEITIKAILHKMQTTRAPLECPLRKRVQYI